MFDVLGLVSLCVVARAQVEGFSFCLLLLVFLFDFLFLLSFLFSFLLLLFSLFWWCASFNLFCFVLIFVVVGKSWLTERQGEAFVVICVVVLLVFHVRELSPL